ARDTVGPAPGRAAAGASPPDPRGAVVDRPTPLRVVRARPGAVIDLAPVHPLGGPPAPEARPLAAPERARRTERRGVAERPHPTLSAPDAAHLTAPDAAHRTAPGATAEPASAGGEM